MLQHRMRLDWTAEGSFRIGGYMANPVLASLYNIWTWRSTLPDLAPGHRHYGSLDE